MPDDVKPAVLSVAQFRAQLESRVSRLARGEMGLAAMRCELKRRRNLANWLTARYAEARQASAATDPRDAIFRWLLGIEGEFPPMDMRKKYAWRSELRRRLDEAGIKP